MRFTEESVGDSIAAKSLTLSEHSGKAVFAVVVLCLRGILTVRAVTGYA